MRQTLRCTVVKPREIRSYSRDVLEWKKMCEGETAWPPPGYSRYTHMRSVITKLHCIDLDYSMPNRA
jgi:hypothetical protein